MSKRGKIFLFEERKFKNIDDLIEYQFELNDISEDQFYFIINKTLISKEFFLEVYCYTNQKGGKKSDNKGKFGKKI